MKYLLVAINAKYIHSNLAVYSIEAYLKKYLPALDVEIAEYTINNNIEDILQSIYEKKSDIVGFSCYIWNIEIVSELIRDLYKISDSTAIWLGGPEVSYRAEEFLETFPMVRGIIRGEGEATSLELFSKLLEYSSFDDKLLLELRNVAGLTYRDMYNNIHSTQEAGIMDMNKLVFPYPYIEDRLENRIIYYESSRGCPFRCSYCLSSIDKKLRFRNTDIVFEELEYFLRKRVKQVKFVDRTFNADKEHARAIWRYILQNDNGITNFHFEIEAKLLTEEDLEILRKMRPGLVQLEIGVQTTNVRTLKEIRRYTNSEDIKNTIESINSFGNIHIHLDLIAGLPFEDKQSFIKSFNEVYLMRPNQLQLGFLKILSGSYMSQMQEEYGIKRTQRAPYTVLSTKWLSYEDVCSLRGVEEMVEVYHNSNQFTNSLKLIESRFESPFHLYEGLSSYYKENNISNIKHSRLSRYDILYTFLKEHIYKDEVLFELEDALLMDLYLRENIKKRPDWARREDIDKDYRMEVLKSRGLKSNEAHIERLHNQSIVLFDYFNRDPLTYNAYIEYL